MVTAIVGRIVTDGTLHSVLDGQPFFETMRYIFLHNLFGDWLRNELNGYFPLYCVTASFVSYRIAMKRFGLRKLARIHRGP